MASRRSALLLASVLAFSVATALSAFGLASHQEQQAPARPPNPDGWQIPPGAADEANPLPAEATVLARGGEVYKSKCERCHGVRGKGDGPDADPETPPDDLSDASRARRNPDGVMFYKVWNGRRKPKMPAYRDELTKHDTWAVVHYAKSLRQPAP
jgi:mono/diheme cytochrome c family protein